MKKLFNKFNILIFALACLLVVSAGLVLYGVDSYNLGKASIGPQVEQTNNEFTLRIQQLQLDVAEKQAENTQLRSEIETYLTEVTNLTKENSSLQSQVNTLTTERDNAIASGESSQEEIDELNSQITTLNAIIEQNETTISEYNGQIATYQATITENEAQISSLNGSVSRLASIIDKSVTEIYAEDLEGLTSIGRYAFYECYSLRYIELPNTITKIGMNAFDSCTALKNIEFPQSLEVVEGYSFKGSGLVSVTIPSGVSFGGYSFSYCKSLKSVILEEGLTSLGNSIFSNCSFLTEITFPQYSFTTINDGCFYECTSLKSVVFPDTMTYIGNNVFYKCTSLESVILPDNDNLVMGKTVFYDCSKLQKTIYDNASYLGTSNNPYALLYWRSGSPTSCIVHKDTKFIYVGSFAGCSSLTSIDFTSCTSLISIFDQAFKGCTGLTSITLPSTIKYIGSEVFSGCKNLTDITILSETPPTLLDTNSFTNCTATIHVNGVEVYKSATNWKSLSNSFVEISDEGESNYGDEIEI